MYTQVESRLVIASVSTAEAFSQAVSMQGGNAAFVDMTVFNQDADDIVTPTLQLSNDVENWEDNDAAGGGAETVDITGVDYGAVKVAPIASQYVRLKFTRTINTGNTKAVVAAGINVADL
jgi:hypothetical protein